MKYLKLPDLGEGLQEAEIVEWHVSVGDSVAVDQLLVSVETAKAIVDIPSPQAGMIAALFGQPGDLLHIGEPLLEYANEQEEDRGTVVGSVVRHDEPGRDSQSREDHFIIGAAGGTPSGHALATPAIRALAARLDVDLANIHGSGKNGLITGNDVEQAAHLTAQFGAATALRGVARTMANNMARAHAEVAAVSLFDDVDIHAWPAGTDPTLRLVQAIAYACREVPKLNAWFDGNRLTLRCIEQVDLGIAVDTPDGLFVPVLRDIGRRSSGELRDGLNRLREDVQKRTIPPRELQGATLTLSNFGTLAGRYATPVVVPPTVAIVGAGVIRNEVLASNGQPVVHPVLPLSLTFDHRALTGGEAARFLRALMQALAQADGG